MTPTLSTGHSGRSQQTVFKTQPMALTVPRGAAEVACAIFLRKVAPFIWPNEDDRSAVINAVVDVVPVNSGRPIPFSARPSAHLHLLVEGWAFRSHTTPSGARLITDIVLPGDLFDWAPTEFCDTGNELRACGPALVAVLQKKVDGGSLALSRCCEWARDAEARSLRSRLVNLGRRNARLRVAHFISELHHRLHKIGLADADSFECPLTQEQLADVLGLTPVHVNRVLQTLRREGLLRFHRPRVVLPDLARLHAEAGYAEWMNESDDGDR